MASAETTKIDKIIIILITIYMKEHYVVVVRDPLGLDGLMADYTRLCQ